jgi:hypothetical protein
MMHRKPASRTATRTETVGDAMEVDHKTETAIMTDAARIAETVTSAQTGAGGAHPTSALRGATPAAIRVGGEAEAEMMTDVTHAAAEMATTTGVREDGLALAPDLRMVATALATTATVGIAGTAMSMAGAEITAGGTLGLMLHPPRMSVIVAPSLFSSSPPACVPVS